MTRTAESRQRVLQELVRLTRPLEEIAVDLQRLGWDSSHQVLTVQAADMVDVLQRYLDSNVTAEDLEQWANLIEGREDLALEGGECGMVKRAIFDLANPSLGEGVSEAIVRNILKRLDRLET